MNNVFITLTGLNNLITRPVANKVLKTIKRVTKINTGTEILMKSNNDILQQPMSDITNRDPNGSVGFRDELLTVNISENFDPEQIYDVTISRKNSIPVFKDTNTLVELCPIYVDSIMTIEVEYSAKSRTTIESWINLVRLNISSHMDRIEHILDYSYPIPNPSLNLLIDTHKLIENIDGYGESFKEYLIRCSDGRLALATDIAGDKLELIVKERQSRVHGFFSFDPMPENKEYDSDSLMFKARFTYTVTYNKPIGLHMLYPASIHNQLLPEKYTISTNLIEQSDDYLANRDDNMDAFKKFEQHLRLYVMNPWHYIRIPHFDYWPNFEPPSFTAYIFRALCLLEENDRRTLLNLRQLGDIVIDDDILEWIRVSELPYINKLYTSFLHLGIYKDNDLLEWDYLTVDDNLTVSSTVDLTIRSRYRVALNIIVDISILNEEAISRLLNYPNVAVKIIRAINNAYNKFPNLRESTYGTCNLLRRLDNNELDISDMCANDLLVTLRGLNSDYLDYYTGMKTVQFQHIISFRSDQK